MQLPLGAAAGAACRLHSGRPVNACPLALPCSRPPHCLQQQTVTNRRRSSAPWNAACQMPHALIGTVEGSKQDHPAGNTTQAHQGPQHVERLGHALNDAVAAPDHACTQCPPEAQRLNRAQSMASSVDHKCVIASTGYTAYVCWHGKPSRDERAAAGAASPAAQQRAALTTR